MIAVLLVLLVVSNAVWCYCTRACQRKGKSAAAQAGVKIDRPHVKEVVKV